MSLLPSAVFATSIAPTGGASDYAANALWATAGAAGPGGGVTQLVAGANITLDPPTGEGVVTITASGGGAGGVTSVSSGGPGITCIPTTGAVVVDNTGVTSLVAGPGVAISGATGAVTVSTSGFPVFTPLQTFTYNGNGVNETYTVTSNAFRILFNQGGNTLFVAGVSGWLNNGDITIGNPAWNDNTIVMVTCGGAIGYVTGLAAANFTGGVVSCGGAGSFRRVNVTGSGATIPTTLGPGGATGSQYLYFLVFQAAP